MRDAIDNVICFEETFQQFLDRSDAIYSKDWYKALPQYAKAEVFGWVDCYSEQLRDAVYKGKLLSCHLYQGKLYRSFEEWRNAFPSADASGLNDTCCTAWPSGKIFNHYIHGEQFEHGFAASDLVGQTFPFAGEEN